MRSQIQYEKDTIRLMISLYCLKNHRVENLCVDCKEILEYANFKLENCKFGERKPTCKTCCVHCYSLEKRNKIKNIMRFSGPRMLFYYPINALQHILRNLKYQK